MIRNQLPVPAAKKQTHWPSLLVMVNAGIGLLFFLGIAGISFINGFLTLFNQETSANDAAVSLSYTVAGLLLSILLLPAIVYAIQRIRGTLPASSRLWQRVFSRLHPQRLILLYPLLLLLGYWLNNLQAANWIFMPVINVLVLSIPVAWLLWIGSRRLRPGSPQRSWSTFSLGITVSPLLIMTLEILFMIAGFFVIFFLVSTVFAGTDLNIDSLLSAITQATESQQIPEQAVVEFIQQPAILAVILFFISGFVPLVEEIIKPMAVWLLWRTPLTPQDGWLLGLLSGAGFALVENFGNTAVGEGWFFLALARFGASALHIFNSAIISYTVLLAREKKRLLPAVLGLAGAILIHALWNGITIFATLSTLKNSVDGSGTWPIGFIIVIALISASMIAGILMINKHLAEKNLRTVPVRAGTEVTNRETEVPEYHKSE
jgi:hypothetical protein